MTRNRRREVRRRPAPAYWHGGTAGMKVGASITPPIQRGPLPTAYRLDIYPASPHHVYVTQDRNFARYFAALTVPPGTLYRVVPVGDLVADDDYPATAKSFTCTKAVIVAIEERHVTASDRLHLYGNRFNTWTGGGPMYDAAGYMLPSPEMEQIGITPAVLRGFGFLPTPESVTNYLAAKLRMP